MPRPLINNKCDLCKKERIPMCVDICPVVVFEKEKSKIAVKKPTDCIGCRACEVQCPKQAIVVD